MTPAASGGAAPSVSISPIIGGILFTGCGLVAAFRQQAWELPVIHALNAASDRWAMLDYVVHTLTSCDLLQGAMFVSVAWYLWFDTADDGVRARLLTGIFAASLAGVISRLLQIVLPTHLRPLHALALDFVTPMGVEPDTLNHFNAFPSDHGAVFFGLALVIFRMQPRLGLLAIFWATVVDVGRIYEGYHYPSDVVGSIGLALMVVGAFDNRWFTLLAHRLLVLERTYRPTVYLVAFRLSYQIATLFDDVRQIGHGFARVVLHHGPFSGS